MDGVIEHSMANDSTSFVLPHIKYSDKLHLSCERKIFYITPDLSQNKERDVIHWESIR